MKNPFYSQRISSLPFTITPQLANAAILALVSALLIVRLFTLISNHAVNVLYWDQWEFYAPLFEHRSLWEHFTWLHGPQRQGLGGILINIIAGLSGWNTRVEAFAIGGISCLAMAAALGLKRRLFGQWAATDAAIPLIVLTLCQYQIYLGASNIAYGALPCLLLFLYCLALTSGNRMARYAAIAILNFLLIFTGWGIFIAPITVAALLLDCLHPRKHNAARMMPLAALAVSIASIAAFLFEYKLNTAAQPLPDHQTRLWEYPLFMVLMFARFVRPETGKPGILSMLAFAFGLALFLVTIAVFLQHARAILRGSPDRNRRLPVCVLTGYCLLFTLNTAIGRASMGLNVSQSSRYMSLMIPGMLGLYFHLLALESSRAKRIILAVFLALLIPGHLPLALGGDHPASYFSVNKRNWKDCYLKYEDIAKCDALPDLKTDFTIGIGGAKWKLDYLKQRQLNLYLDDK